MKQTQEYEIALTRSFRAPPERVFDAWTDPAKLARWFGPDGFSTTTHEFDLRPGGTWRHTMRGPDGRDYPNKIVFVELARPDRLVYDHVSGPPFRTTVVFEKEDGGGTRMSFRMVFPDAESYRVATQQYGAQEGAKQTVARLASFVEEAPIEVRPARRTYWPAFTVERVFRAPVEKVWRMWTTKEGLEAWYWPEPLVAHVKRLDLRVGGGWEIAAEGLPHTSRATFTEIVPHERLGMIAPIDFIPDVEPYDRGDTIEFHRVAEGTKMTFTSTRMHSDTWQKASGSGWSSSIDRLTRALEGGPEPARGFTLEREFKAPPEKVWEMWTTPEGIAKWWAPSAREMGFDMRVRHMDVRVGGTFAFEMKNDKHALVNRGTYTMVEPHWELAWTWHYDIYLSPDEKPYDVPILVTFTRTPAGGTKMTFMQGPLAKPGFTEGSRQGVMQNLGYLAKALGE